MLGCDFAFLYGVVFLMAICAFCVGVGFAWQEALIFFGAAIACGLIAFVGYKLVCANDTPLSLFALGVGVTIVVAASFTGGAAYCNDR